MSKSKIDNILNISNSLNSVLLFNGVVVATAVSVSKGETVYTAIDFIHDVNALNRVFDLYPALKELNNSVVVKCSAYGLDRISAGIIELLRDAGVEVNESRLNGASRHDGLQRFLSRELGGNVEMVSL